MPKFWFCSLLLFSLFFCSLLLFSLFFSSLFLLSLFLLSLFLFKFSNKGFSKSNSFSPAYVPSWVEGKEGIYAVWMFVLIGVVGGVLCMVVMFGIVNFVDSFEDEEYTAINED
jgi:hypothetical protein